MDALSPFARPERPVEASGPSGGQTSFRVPESRPFGECVQALLATHKPWPALRVFSQFRLKDWTRSLIQSSMKELE